MSRQLFEEARKVLTQEAAVKLDPVGQEDKDVDNDGDSDKTDSYLKKRRGAISAAIAKSKNESALSEEDLAKLKAILGEMKKKEEMEDEEEDEEDEMEDEKKMKNEGMQKAQVPPKGPKPEEVPAYMRKGNARQKFPLDLKDLKKEENEQLGESGEMGPVKDTRGAVLMVHKTSGREKNIVNDPKVIKQHQEMGYEKAKSVKEEVQIDEADELRSRGGIAAVNRMPRAGQTDFRNIAAGNHPESQRKFSDKDRKELPGLLKAKIKSSLGKHTKPNLPEQKMAEEVEQTDEAKLNPAGKAAVRDVTKKIGAKTLSQTKAIVALAKLDPKKVKEEVEQTDEAMSPQAKTTMKHIPNPTAGEMKAAKDIKPGIAGYRDRIDMLKSAEARGGLKKEEVEQEDFELIEKLNFEVPDNPSYQDYFKAALKMAQVESFSELDEEDQQYIMNEMENAFRQNDTSFILEADMMGDMNDTVQRLRKAGHKVEDMGRDYKGNPFYIYIDKGSMMRRKVTYKGTQKVTQNMGRAQPEKEEDKQ